MTHFDGPSSGDLQSDHHILPTFFILFFMFLLLYYLNEQDILDSPKSSNQPRFHFTQKCHENTLYEALCATAECVPNCKIRDSCDSSLKLVC